MIEGINVPNFRKTLEIMAAEPQLVDMDTWWKSTSCGTTACLAGHAVTLVGDFIGGTGSLGLVEVNGRCEAVEYVAGEVLGLNSTVLRNAFFYRPAGLEGRHAVAVLYQMAELVTDGEIRMPPEFDADYLEVTAARGGIDPALDFLSDVPGFKREAIQKGEVQ